MCSGSLAKRDVRFLRVSVIKEQQIRTVIAAPVDASNFNVFEKDEVQRELRNDKYQARLLVRDGDLLDFTTCETHNDRPPLPGDTFE